MLGEMSRCLETRVKEISDLNATDNSSKQTKYFLSIK